jgi:hypothetical protein
MSAFGGKADMATDGQNVRLRPKADVGNLGYSRKSPAFGRANLILKMRFQRQSEAKSLLPRCALRPLQRASNLSSRRLLSGERL